LGKEVIEYLSVEKLKPIMLEANKILAIFTAIARKMKSS